MYATIPVIYIYGKKNKINVLPLMTRELELSKPLEPSPGNMKITNMEENIEFPYTTVSPALRTCTALHPRTFCEIIYMTY